ncbi:MAG: RHS repeat protein, partial [Betaproteobacteria bacterium]|nr:RHS repeat protein [Betaproteobacteria bacterium]
MSYARTIDQDGRIASYTLGATAYNLSFDDAGNITRISDPANTALDKVFGYDRIDRLLSLSTNPTTLNQSFTFDKVGNRLTRVLNGATTNYTLATTSNRLTAVGGIARTSDAAGNQTADGTSSFTYSDRGRLSGATTPLGSVAYAVNALGQRVRKTVGTVSTHYAFDLEGRLLGEYDGAGNPIQEVVWLKDTPVATIRPNGGTYQVFHVWADHLDTPRLVTDAAVQVRWEWANTDPFGANPANENPAGLGAFAFNLR